MARREWDVVIAYLQNREAAEDVAERASALGSSVVLHEGNLAQRQECHTLVERIGEQVGRLDGMVHCAALGALSPTLETRPARWKIAWDSHVGAFIELVSEARALLSPGAGVVALSSLGTHRVTPGYGSVAAAKAALETVTRYMAVELGEQAIKVNAICGGPIDTDSLRIFPYFDEIEALCRTRPGGRIGQPEDIAPIVAFLLSPDAAWISGQVIVADGGFSLV
jgi:NAD(P)-dependent dehydrogenase (short-subunit alcohol dehydrogenase family)